MPRQVRYSAFFSGGHNALTASRMSLSAGFGKAFFGFSGSDFCACFAFGFFSCCGGFFFAGSTWILTNPSRAVTVSSSPNFTSTPTRVRHSSRNSTAKIPRIHNAVTAAAPFPYA